MPGKLLTSLIFKLLLIIGATCLGCHSPKEFQVSPISAEVRGYRGKPTIFLNNEPVTPMIYGLTDVPGGRWSWEEVPQHNIRQFCEQGIHLFQLDLFLEQIWQEDGSMNLSLAQKQVNGVLEVCPDAGIFLRFHVNAPKWWVAQHPEEKVIYDGPVPMPEEEVGFGRIMEADARIPIRASFASGRWKAESLKKLAEFCRSFSKTTAGNHLVGIQVANGVYGEWHQWGFMRHEADFSKPMEDHFREWLKHKYGNSEKLQQAWGTVVSDFSKVTLPDTNERKITSAGIFRHPLKDRKVIDYYSCQHELVADLIIEFCKVIKENWSRPIITGTFYGYYFSVFGREAAGGHLAFQKVLASDHVDYLSGPQSYYPDNGYLPGEPYRSRTLNHSILLNDKLWLDEYDQQPRRVWPHQGLTENREAYQKALATNVSLIRRNILYPLLKGQGLWFYDFGPAGMELHSNNQRNDQAGSSGYWDHPVYMRNIGVLKSIADKMVHQEYQSSAEVLAVYDTESIKYMKSTKENPCPITPQLINYSTLALFYSGALFDAIHIADLEKANLSQYKVVLFFNTFIMDTSTKKLIKTKVAREDRHLVWVYAPGYLDDESFGKELVSTLTGINLEITQHDQSLKILFNKEFTQMGSMKAEAPYDPVFYVDDPEMQELGSYDQLKLTAFGYKKQENHTSWYSGIPILDADVFRQILKRAGIEVFAENGDVVYGNKDWIMLHSNKNGLKKLPKNREVNVEAAPVTILQDQLSGQLILE